MELSSLISAVIVLVIIGVVLYLLTTYIPMAAPIKTVITVLVVIACVLYLLRVAGVYSGPLLR